MKVLILFAGCAGYYPYCAGKAQRLMEYLTKHKIDVSQFEYSGKSSGTIPATCFALGVPLETFWRSLAKVMPHRSNNLLSVLPGQITTIVDGENYYTYIEKGFRLLLSERGTGTAPPLPDDRLHIAFGKKKNFDEYDTKFISKYTSTEDLIETIMISMYLQMFSKEKTDFRWHKVRKFYGRDLPCAEGYTYSFADPPEGNYDLKIYIAPPLTLFASVVMDDKWTPSTNPHHLKSLYEEGYESLKKERLRDVLKAFENGLGCKKFTL